MLYQFPAFMSTYRFWVASSLASAFVLVRVAPQYSVRQSYSWTASVLFLLHWLVYGVYTVILYPRFLSPLRHLPTVPGGSFFNGQWSTLVKEPPGAPMSRWANEIPNDGLIRYMHLFNRERLLITNPKALAEVLTTRSYDFIKPELMRNGLGQLLGNGILLVEGEEHKTQRKNLMPAFQFRHIKELYPLFWAKSVDLVGCIRREIAASTDAEPSVEIGQWGSRATLDIIGAAGMDQEFDSLNDPTTELNQVYRQVFQPDRTAQLLQLLQFLLPHVIAANLPLPRNKTIQAARAVARDTCRRLVEQKKKRLADKEPMRPDIISVALESGGFNDEDLVNNMMTFLAAGHETTAASFTWAMYLLCQHPEYQDRLRAEIHAHIPALTADITHDVIDNMPFLHAVCQETLRLWSPVPLTLRDTAANTTILGHFVPKDTKIILSPAAVNKDFKLWGSDADKFNPDRWMAPGQANAGGAVSNYAFLTFLHGPRSCIGSKFALAEFACLVAAVIGTWEVRMVDPDETIEVKSGITIRPKNGLRVILKDVGWGN